MTQEDILNKNIVLINYLQTLTDEYKFKAEYSTNDNDTNVIVVQEEAGEKIVFFGDVTPLFNYYTISIYGDNIKDEKDTSVILGQVIGKSVTIDFNGQKWQIIFKQLANPRTIQYMDIRRVAYTMTLKCIVNRIS
jgi:hypothetical protein